MSNIILVGMSRVGKTFTGQKLAILLQAKFIDTDKELEKNYNKPIKAVFNELGKDKFRDEEYKTLKAIIKTHNQAVIATGGGIIENTKTCKLLKAEKNVIFLHASHDFIFTRIKQEIEASGKLPSFLKARNTKPADAEQAFKELYETRKPLYEQVATLTITLDQNNIDAICQEIIEGISKN